MTQPELNLFRPGVTGDDVARLSAHLNFYGWQTRQEVGDSLRWTERKIRDVAESMGSEIVRVCGSVRQFNPASKEPLTVTL